MGIMGSMVIMIFIIPMLPSLPLASGLFVIADLEWFAGENLHKALQELERSPARRHRYS